LKRVEKRALEISVAANPIQSIRLFVSVTDYTVVYYSMDSLKTSSQPLESNSKVGILGDEQQEESRVKNMYGGLLPKKKAFVGSGVDDRAEKQYFDSADWQMNAKSVGVRRQQCGGETRLGKPAYMMERAPNGMPSPSKGARAPVRSKSRLAGGEE
jgi:hypothetical protein